jgi:hypothetical protein
MDFGKADPDDNYCGAYQSGDTTFGNNAKNGCVKFIGLPRGSVLKIFTVALAKVREFAPADINFPVPLPGAGMNSDIGWIAWNGDNEDRNPVSTGLYFYVVEPPAGEKFIGKLAISRARKVK